MITTGNYYTEVAKIGINKLPETLIKSHEFVDKVSKQGQSWDTYNKSDAIKRTIDLYFTKLYEFGAKIKPAAKSKPTVSAKEKKYVYDGTTYTEQGIIDFANTTLHYDLEDNGEQPFTDANEALKALKNADKAPAKQKSTVVPERKKQNKLIVTFTGRKDSWGRKLYKGNDGNMYADVDGIIHELTTSGEPNIPVSAKIIEPKSTVPAHNKNAKSVEKITDDISVIKRYVGFHGKTKTKEQCSNLLKALQKAILEKRIGKHSMYGKEVMKIQDSLITCVNDRAVSFQIIIGDSSLERYKEIVDSVAPLVSISLLKRYVGLIGKSDIKEKVKRLADHFDSAFKKGHILESDPYVMQVTDAFNNLQNYLVGNAKTLFIEEYQLNGLRGMSGLGNPTAFAASAILASFIQTHIKDGIEKLLPKKKPEVAPIVAPLNGVDGPEVMTISAAKSQSFKKIGFTGDLQNLIGDACEPTSIFIYGNGGSGKSSLSLYIASELNKLGYSILYVAGEQFNTPTFSKLLKVTGITGNNRFKIVKSLNTLPMRNWDVIVIDSKESVGLTASGDFKALRDSLPPKIYVLTSQGTKAGDFAGDEKWRNEVDTMVYCEKGVASTLEDKNRWGGKAEIKFF